MTTWRQLSWRSASSGQRLRHIYIGFLLPGHTVSNSPDRWFPLTRIFISGTLYSMDKDEESMKVRDEMMESLSKCTPEQLAAFKSISEIFVDDVKHQKKSEEKKKVSTRMLR